VKPKTSLSSCTRSEERGKKVYLYFFLFFNPFLSPFSRFFFLTLNAFFDLSGFIGDEFGGASMIKAAGYENEIDILFYLYGEEDASAYLMFSKKSMTEEEVNKIRID